jgi:hypothetical protein
MKNSKLILFVSSIIMMMFLLTFTSCSGYSGNRTQDERIEANVANDQHQVELASVVLGEEDNDDQLGNPVVISDCDTNDENPVIGSIVISKKSYNVHEGPRGGLYIWRIRTKDTTAGDKGSCYKSGLSADLKLKVERY